MRCWCAVRLSAGILVATGIVSASVAELSAQPGTVTREEALASVFPGATVEPDRVFLTTEQRDEIEERARVKVPSRLIARYVATLRGEVVGRAYVDTHVVRTKRESILISLNADGTVRRIDVMAFLEPPDFMASGRWYQQYYGRELNDELSLRRAIRTIAGATLTGAATNGAVRRALATDQMVEAEP